MGHLSHRAFSANTRLEPDRYSARSLLWWEQERLDWTRYDRVMLTPAVVYDHLSARGERIDPDELKKLTDYFEDVVRAELAGHYPVVAETAAGVLRIKATITDLEPALSVVNVVSRPR